MFFQTPSLDLDLFLLINQQMRLGLFDIIMPLLSSKLVLFGLLGVPFCYAIFKYGKRQVILFLILLVGMGLCDLTTNIVKKQVKRVRPLNAIASTYLQEDGEWIRRAPDFVQTKEKGTSYPSAHAASTMCVAILAILLWPGLRKWPLLLPILVGYSRVYLGKHYPTDVVAGWLFGAVVAGVLWLIWDNVISTRIQPIKS